MGGELSFGQVVKERRAALGFTQTEVASRVGCVAITISKMGTINRLNDYHDRILRTHNSALNIQTSLNFFTSLLLPIIGFVLTNLEKVLAYF